MTDGKKTCFVVMGFGMKPDPGTGRTLNLDKSYRGVIRPAVKDAGLDCVRADEIVHSGSIDSAMYKQLLEADVVVADISTLNANAMYELGVRHALRPFTTIIVAEDQVQYPFDVNHTVIRRYRHLGDAIDVEEAERFRGELTAALQKLLSTPEPDSPVYTFLNRLKPPILEMLETVEEDAGDGAASRAPPSGDVTLSAFTLGGERALAEDRFDAAVTYFTDALGLRPGDPYLTQRLALATYKSANPSPLGAFLEARKILQALDPDVSNDPETLGLWGSVHKHLWFLTGERKHLDTAILAHERGFDIRNDPYNGINLAFLFNVRAKVSTPAEQIADFVNAERVRRRVMTVCADRLQEVVGRPEDRYWLKATLVEAAVGIGDTAAAEKWQKEADAENAAPWMRSSTAKQIAALRELLVPSPLDMIRPPAGS